MSFHLFNTPDREGFWRHVPSREIYEIYALEPAGGQLCFWGPEHGITYSGASETQQVWDTDEWQGHVPVVCHDPEGPWEFISENDQGQAIRPEASADNTENDL